MSISVFREGVYKRVGGWSQKSHTYMWDVVGTRVREKWCQLTQSKRVEIAVVFFHWQWSDFLDVEPNFLLRKKSQRMIAETAYHGTWKKTKDLYRMIRKNWPKDIFWVLSTRLSRNRLFSKKYILFASWFREIYLDKSATQVGGCTPNGDCKSMRPRAPRVGNKCGRQVGDTCKSMRPTAPRVGGKCGRQAGDKCKSARPRAPRVGEKCGGQAGDKCKSVRPRAPRVPAPWNHFLYLPFLFLYFSSLFRYFCFRFLYFSIAFLYLKNWRSWFRGVGLQIRW